MNELPAAAMAQAGLWMIREAIAKLIRERGPIQPRALEDALGLGRPIDGDWRGIGYELMMWMAEEGGLEKGEGTRPAYSLPSTRH